MVHGLRTHSPLWEGRRTGKNAEWPVTPHPQSGSRDQGALVRGSLSAFDSAQESRRRAVLPTSNIGPADSVKPQNTAEHLGVGFHSDSKQPR